VGEFSWVGLKPPATSFEAIAQLRYRHKGVRVKVTVDQPGIAQAKFLDQWSTVSPGQAAVFYDLNNKEVLGGGRIQSS